MSERPSLTILAPMSIEAHAMRAGAPWARVRRIGVGRRAAGVAAATVAGEPGAPVLLAGFCGALRDDLQPGDVILATEVLEHSAAWSLPDPSVLAGVLRRGGCTVHCGPLAGTRLPAIGAGARRRIGASGALAADMESAPVVRALRERAGGLNGDVGAAAATGGGPAAVLRVVLDTPSTELWQPRRVAHATARAYSALRRAASQLEDWARALGPGELVLAAPRASCAGVERAVEIVERALQERGRPVYVRKQIVHNAHVIAELEARGAVFVDELDEVPLGATVIFSAHGVSPSVRDHAAERELDVIDATCPLVAKVHAEARRFEASGHEIVLVGHEHHEEVEGTFGEAPQRTHIVATPREARSLRLRNGAPVAVLTQTTLAIDETAEVIETLRERFPDLAAPRSSDICYATQNRQDAVRALAADCDPVLVIGSGNSSNSQRLVEVARRAGTRAVLIEDGTEIPPALLAGARRVGVTAGASAPESLVQEVVRALAGVGRSAIAERTVAREDAYFKLPVGLRGGGR